jgi:hypothetical protein
MYKSKTTEELLRSLTGSSYNHILDKLIEADCRFKYISSTQHQQCNKPVGILKLVKCKNSTYWFTEGDDTMDYREFNGWETLNYISCLTYSYTTPSLSIVSVDKSTYELIV